MIRIPFWRAFWLYNTTRHTSEFFKKKKDFDFQGQKIISQQQHHYSRHIVVCPIEYLMVFFWLHWKHNYENLRQEWLHTSVEIIYLHTTWLGISNLLTLVFFYTRLLIRSDMCSRLKFITETIQFYCQMSANQLPLTFVQQKRKNVWRVIAQIFRGSAILVVIRW